jgi:2-amino-4-hydroxy-6-hydroxymethyldihydropteridine diphosphokinase
VVDAAHVAALSLGGNVGDVGGAFRHALARFSQAEGVTLLAQSSVWRTKAWGKIDQPDFLNMAATVETNLSPRELLVLCLAIESERGRARAERWGPRTLDIDILAYGNLSMDEPGLTLPHPRLHERAFVLAPLLEIAPDLRICGKTTREMLSELTSDGVSIDAAATAIVQA